MIIEKIINNNIVCAANGDKLEKILMGKGIGFGKKIGDLVDDSKIEKVFVLSSQEQMHKFLELLAEIPLKYMYLADDIINYAKLTIGNKLSDYLYISLVDHIYAAIKRFKNGLKIYNALYYEIKRFYPDEFGVGEFALNLIKNEIGVELPIDEAGFIALHIVNAYTDNRSIEQVMTITELVQNITNIVKYEFKVDFDESSLNFYRFITHLKFFAKRVIDNQIYLDEADEDFFMLVTNNYYILLFIGFFSIFVTSKTLLKYFINFIEFLIIMFYNDGAGRDTLYTRVIELTFKRHVMSSTTRPPNGGFFYVFN